MNEGLFQSHSPVFSSRSASCRSKASLYAGGFNQRKISDLTLSVALVINTDGNGGLRFTLFIALESMCYLIQRCLNLYAVLLFRLSSHIRNLRCVFRELQMGKNYFVFDNTLVESCSLKNLFKTNVEWLPEKAVYDHWCSSNFCNW